MSRECFACFLKIASKRLTRRLGSILFLSLIVFNLSLNHSAWCVKAANADPKLYKGSLDQSVPPTSNQIEILVKTTDPQSLQRFGKIQALPTSKELHLLKDFKIIKIKTDDLAQVIQELRNNPKVQEFYINYPITFHWQTLGNKDYPSDFPNPSNPLSSYGWYLEKINMPRTWNIWRCTLNPDTCGQFTNPVTIAVIDTGIAQSGTIDSPTNAKFVYTNECNDSNNDGHYSEDECLLPITTPGVLNFDLNFIRSPELSADSIWTNPAPGSNGLCNDTHGADMDIYFYNEQNNIPTDCSNDNRQKEGIPADDYGHGTSVAHVIAAQVNNANPNNPIGIAPDAKLIPIKVNVPFRGWFYLDRLVAAIEYAADLGVNIINISAGTDFDSNLLRDAISYAADRNVLIVASTGNNAQSQAAYPAAYATEYDNVIAAGATGTQDSRAYYSNYIPDNTVYAPVGEDASALNNSVLTQSLACSADNSCAPTYDSNTDTYKKDYDSFILKTVLGTSFAAPQVSAAAAIVKNSAPFATNRELKEILYYTLNSSNIIDTAKLAQITPLIETGKLAVNSNWRHVTFQSNFVIPPKLIVTRTSLFGLDPVYVRIKNLSPTGFDIKVQENKLYDGKHKYEEISYIAFQVSDSGYELGSAYIDHNWTYIKLRNAHSDNVHVLASAVTTNGNDPITVDIKDVTAQGFYVRLQEPAKYDKVHIKEKINWVAIDTAPTAADSGTVSVNNNPVNVNFNKTFQGIPIVLAHTQTENGEDPIILHIDNLNSDGFTINVAEDPRSQDISHTNETIYWLAFDYTNTAIKKGVNYLDHNKLEIRYGMPLSCIPTVFAMANTKNGLQPFKIYLESVTRVGFFAKLIEDKVWDGKHLKEKIVWFAVCPNDSNIATTKALVNHNYATVSLSKSYSNPPYILATSTTHNDSPNYIYVQTKTVNNNSVTLRVGENPRIWGDDHQNETIAILSFEDSSTYATGSIQVNHEWTTVSFTDKGTVPLVFAYITTRNGLDPVQINIKDVTTNSFKIKLEEDSKTYDGAHTYETVNYLIFWP